MPGIISMWSTRKRDEQVYGSKTLAYSLMGLYCNQGYPCNMTEYKAMSTLSKTSSQRADRVA